MPFFQNFNESRSTESITIILQFLVHNLTSYYHYNNNMIIYAQQTLSWAQRLEDYYVPKVNIPSQVN